MTDSAIDVGTFKAKSSVDGSTIQVVCSGEGDSSTLSALEALLEAVHGKAVDAKAAAVVVDLRQVSFMNSSCFTKLIGWVTRVRGMEEAARYQIRLRSNQEILWQRRSLQALKCFAVDLITIES
jgi:hypothetical protein